MCVVSLAEVSISPAFVVRAVLLQLLAPLVPEGSKTTKKKGAKTKKKIYPGCCFALCGCCHMWKYYHHGPGFNCSRFFLCICRALLLLFLYIQAKPGICFHLQQEMQPEAERSPETRAKEELCPGSYISYITGIFHACYRNPQIPGIIPGSLGVTTTFVTGVPSYLKTAGEMGNCHF